jgi:integrase
MTKAYEIVSAAPLEHRAEGITDAEWQALRPHALPKGFRYLVTEGQDVVEPVLLYLHDKCVRSARIRSVGNTERALCDDLYEWFSYLAAFGLRWDVVTTDDVATYRDAMMSSISPATGRPYAVTTVRRRLTTILGFYAWARELGLVETDIDVRTAKHIPREFSRDALAHIRSGLAMTMVSEVLPRPYAEDHVDAFTVTDLERVFGILGPMPGTQGGDRPSRDRVIGFLSFATGMRIEECVKLTKPQLLGLRADPAYGNFPMRITETKGLYPRTVVVPAIVHEALVQYIDGERQEAVKAGRHRVEPTALFLNGAQATRNRGCPITTHTIWRVFNHAVVAAGLTRVVRVVGESGLEDKLQAAHSFHDLRHTFAALMYFELLNAGKAQPWLVLKNLLGHKHLATTMGIYLRSVNVAEAVMTDALDAYLKALRNA